MIVEAILNIVFGISSGFFSLMPDISWNPDTSAFTYVEDIMSVVCYFMPMDTVVTIIGLIISLTVIRVCISLGKTVWDLLPFV